jgi:hypothetical protein
MNSLFQVIGGLRLRVGIVAALFLTQSAFAFFPNSIMIDPFTLGIVNVSGPPGETGGTIEITSIFVSPPGSGSPIAVPGKRTGTTTVPVTFLGASPGLYTVTFTGTYKPPGGQAGPVDGSCQILVRDPPGTSAQIPQIAIGGDPINTSTGEFFGSEGLDLNLGGPMPLFFSRYVASRLASDGIITANLGQNRSHNFASKSAPFGADRRDVILPNNLQENWRQVEPSNALGCAVFSG